ncbi:Metallo-dependent phosphatase-like protein [Mycena rosella]|uniref:Metallo-dependent phosphatase-like protein n=1 Tax=Mycena rosella TaxID=1033263 RepID=A0AAD7G9Q5_MYCRO|nr:Metallo-dependent phosphatase-like protein [Mycena rosella]
MRFAIGLVLAGLSSASALDQWPAHVASQPQRPTPPSRPLQWGDINVIATTDTHGWLLGHEKQSFPEPNYSGTWGDYSAFVTHMKELAAEKDVDLLLVDSGDLHDGTGLTDGFPAGGVDAQDSNEFFKQIPYDVLAIGNHELYTYANTFDMHMNFARHHEGRYLSSNVNITVFDANNQSVSVPVGNRFRKFTTRKGRSVTAFGVLFDFWGNAVNTTLQHVEDMILERWFTDAIADEPDLFLLVGHMPVARDRWPLVFDAIRKVHPTTPILIFGGHSHVRDCLQLDGRSMSLASGRYMETLGWMSLDLDKDSTQSLNFSRRYLDANLVTYQYHTNRTNLTFGTAEGRNITEGLRKLEERFGLGFQYGTAPRDYTMTRAPYPSNDSILTLIVEEATPTVLAMNTSRKGIPSLLIISSGSQRFDIYKGPFTKNDQLTASPFVNEYIYIPDVPFAAATKVLPTLNRAGAERLWPEQEGEGETRQMRMWRQERAVEQGYVDWLEDMHRRYHARPPASAAAQSELTLGYVTTDACPGAGDDVLHTPLPVHRIPDFIASRTPDVGGDPGATVDLVFVDFIKAQVIHTLNAVQTARVYSLVDVFVYSPAMTNEVLGMYAQAAWN